MSAIAIACDGVWKSYRIYHQRSHTLKEKVLSRRNRYEEFWALKGIDLEVPDGLHLRHHRRQRLRQVDPAQDHGPHPHAQQGARSRSTARISSLLELGTGFHPELTGRENVFLGGSLLGQTRRDVEAPLRRASSSSPASSSSWTSPVKNYSSGMYARLAFAVAISVDPEILIVDEVLSVGDESFQIRCYERIAEFRARGPHHRPRVPQPREPSGPCARRRRGSRTGWSAEVGPPTTWSAAYLGGVDREGTLRRALPSTEGVASKKAEVLDVSFLDSEGDEGSKFRTGDAMSVVLRFQAREAVEAVFAIAVFRAGDLAYAFGQNSARADFHCVPGEGDVAFSIASLPLLAGSYVVSVSIHDATGTEVYDAQEQAAAFSVLANAELPALRRPGARHGRVQTSTRRPVPA